MPGHGGWGIETFFFLLVYLNTVEDLGSIPGLGRFPGERKGYTIHGVVKSWTRLNDFHFHVNIVV